MTQQPGFQFTRLTSPSDTSYTDEPRAFMDALFRAADINTSQDTLDVDYEVVWSKIKNTLNVEQLNELYKKIFTFIYICFKTQQIKLSFDELDHALTLFQNIVGLESMELSLQMATSEPKEISISPYFRAMIALSLVLSAHEINADIKSLNEDLEKAQEEAANSQTTLEELKKEIADQISKLEVITKQVVMMIRSIGREEDAEEVLVNMLNTLIVGRGEE